MRKLMFFTIGFTAACIVGTYFFHTWLWLGALLGLLSCIISVVFRKRFKVLPALSIALGVLFGSIWFGVYHHLYLSSIKQVDGTQIAISAEISDYSICTEYGTSVKAEVPIDGKVYHAVLYLNDTKELKPGDHLSGTFQLRLTHEGLQEDTYHRGNGIFLLGYARDKTVYEAAEETSFLHFPAKLRKMITDRIDVLFPNETAFFARALLLGDRSVVDYETNTAFKISGISHIIAVSGLHVSILYSLIFLIAGRKRTIVAIIGIPILILFAAVTGFTPSVTRACVMQILFIIADSALKEYDPPTALSAAVLGMLVCNPISVSSVSLQLSVGCMVGIFLFGERIRNWICSFPLWKAWKGKSYKVFIRNWLASGVAITLSSMFFTTPLVSYYFGSVSLIGVLTNLLVLWAVSWIFYGIMIVCLISLFWQQGALILTYAVNLLIKYVLTVSNSLSAFPLAAVYTKSHFIIAWLVLSYLMVFAFLLFKKRRSSILISGILIGLAISLLLSWIVPLTSNSHITVLDVGQGQSIILQSKGRTFLVDCGGDNPKSAADVAAETLLSMGIYHIDGIILTHYDSDHAGGIPYFLNRIPCDHVFLPEAAEDQDIRQQILDTAGDATILVQNDIHLSWDETTLSIFAPLFQSSDNESGLSVLFSGANCDILITGDLGIAGENKLILNKDIPHLTALIAGHHGSPYSTGESLLAVTRPQYVFISAGKDNPYGHPSQEMLDRLQLYNCIVYRTDQDGSIVFRR